MVIFCLIFHLIRMYLLAPTFICLAKWDVKCRCRKVPLCFSRYAAKYAKTCIITRDDDLWRISSSSEMFYKQNGIIQKSRIIYSLQHSPPGARFDLASWTFTSILCIRNYCKRVAFKWRYMKKCEEPIYVYE